MMLLSFLSVFSLLAATASTACSRVELERVTAEYVAAQRAGNPTNFTSSRLAPTFEYTENELPVDITRSILNTPLRLDSVRNTHDDVECATFTELIAATNTSHPYVIGTRIVMAYTNGRSKIALIESIVTDQGDWAFNATGYLHWTAQENWDPIPEGKRDPREVIKAAGDAYFDRFANVNVSVPWGVPCARLEGGAYTGGRNLSGNTCDLGLPATITVTNRRYVVDEIMGTVDIYVGFPGLDRSQRLKPAPDSHFFRVEGGKIRYIHTVSSCVEAGCGMNGQGPPPKRMRRIRRSL